jgi:hypothetical protein
MPGVFGTSTLPMAMGKANRALYNQAAGTVTVQLRAKLGTGPGIGLGSASNVSLYASFFGKSYPFDYL